MLNIEDPLPSAKEAPKVKDASFVSPSPASYPPSMTSRDMPSKSSLRIMLTTPAIASDPYTDDAPPVITSSFSIKSVGIELRST